MTFTTRVPGAILTEREHTVPLDHARPDGPTITVFTREVADPDGTDRPYLVFLQGGPGIEATRPTSPPTGWMARALKDYRVLLLDQRGTGRSTPVGAVIPGDTPEAQATYLTHFRADSIVRDAEAIRAELGSIAGASSARASVASPGMTYLSIAPDGLREAFLTGGLAPDRTTDRRRLQRDLSPDHRVERALLRPVPGGSRPGPGDPRAPRRVALPPRRPAIG